MNNCACCQSSAVEFDQRLIVLEALRQRCPVLRELLLPTSIWNQYKSFEQSPRDNALHAPTLILSLLHGNLRRVTSPCHKFLFDGEQIKAQVTNQYRQDLQERWMFEADEIERHRKSKIFRGKIVELQIAEWLETQGWKIHNLEALGAAVDIEGVRPVSQTAAVEVKFIGQRDEEFEQGVNAFTGLPAGGVDPTHLGCNYLLFRVFESAFKLRQVGKRRTAIIVIDDLAWRIFQIPLQHKWIDWKQPSFFDVGKEWDSFLQEQKKRYPSIDTDLVGTINTLYDLWVAVRDSRQIFSTRFNYSFS
jgi:hypothetical protein